MERNGREEGEVSMDEEQNFIIKLYGTKFISFIHPLLLSSTPSSPPTASLLLITLQSSKWLKASEETAAEA